MRVLKEKPGGAFMVAWSPRGDEIWYAAHDIRAVSLSGQERVMTRFPEPTWAHLNDIAPDGRVLLVLADYRGGILALPPGQQAREHEISWQGHSNVADLTPDGRTILFDDDGGCYLRKTDGISPAVRVCADCMGLSADAQWVACLSQGKSSELLVSPTGPGDSRVVAAKGIEFTGRVQWFPDGKRLLVPGRAPGRPPASYVISLDGGTPRAVTPEGVTDSVISSDGRWIAAKNGDGNLFLYPIEGGEPKRPPGGPEPGELTRWAVDGRSIFVTESNGRMARIFRRNLVTGARELWKELVPADLAGIFGISVSIAEDGQSYVYGYSRWLSNLYVVKGLK